MFQNTVKTGLNVPESFKFLLNNIISRMKNMEKTKEMITFDPSTTKFRLLTSSSIGRDSAEKKCKIKCCLIS